MLNSVDSKHLILSPVYEDSLILGSRCRICSGGILPNILFNVRSGRAFPSDPVSIFIRRGPLTLGSS